MDRRVILLPGPPSAPNPHYKFKAGRLFASSASSHRGPDSAVLSPKQRASRHRSRIATGVPLAPGDLVARGKARGTEANERRFGARGD
jgi:hypothetical protein